MPVGSNFWHKDELTRLRELWESGVPTKDIAKMMTKSVNGVRTKAHRIGLSERLRPAAKDGLPAQQISAVIKNAMWQMYKAGVPVPDIAKEVNLESRVVQIMLSRMERRKKSTVKKIAKTNSERAAKTGANIVLRVIKAVDGACLHNGCKHLGYAPRYVCYTHAA